ncbi:MAG: phosphoesterase, partial [Pedobacter sp.]|nr:phosphoesterase [Pedobacter sp.]
MMIKKSLKITKLLKVLLLAVLCLTFMSSCKKKSKKVEEVDVIHQNEAQLTKIIIYDVFTPPVASRIYAYSSLAAYETLRNKDPKVPSFTDRLNGFAPMPKPEKGKDYNYTLAATKAFFTVVHKMVFSLDSLAAYENKVNLQFKDELSPEVYERSVALGDTIGKTILLRAATDGYIKSRGKARYLGSNLPGKWRPTAPDYADAVEWCWNDIKTLAIDRTFLEKNLLKPVPYNLDPKSAYYKQLDSVYHLTKNLSAEQKEIATFWDDNPFTVQHSGHMMFGNKKITPGGHWMSIA